jgi:putative phage-type endonuclease
MSIVMIEPQCPKYGHPTVRTYARTMREAWPREHACAIEHAYSRPPWRAVVGVAAAILIGAMVVALLAACGDGTSARRRRSARRTAHLEERKEMNAIVTFAGPAQQDRSSFLGGSDAAAVMGLSPWATPVELWQQKTMRAKKEAPDAAAVKRWARGHKMEPFIREMAIDKLRDMGLAVELITCNERYTDQEHPWMSCEIDFELRLTGECYINGELARFDGEHINADAKSVHGFARKKWGEEDTEDVPIEYAAQFMFGLMVTGRNRCLVAALRSFDDVDIYWTLRDDETIAGMRPKLVEFWVDHVQADVPPDPMKFSDIKALFPLDDGQAVDASQDIADKVARLRTVKADIKALEGVEESLAFDIADWISPHALLRFNGKEIASWKAQSATRLDQAALREQDPAVFAKFSTTTTTRVLRLKKGP